MDFFLKCWKGSIREIPSLVLGRKLQTDLLTLCCGGWAGVLKLLFGYLLSLRVFGDVDLV